MTSQELAASEGLEGLMGYSFARDFEVAPLGNERQLPTIHGGGVRTYSGTPQSSTRTVQRAIECKALLMVIP